MVHVKNWKTITEYVDVHTGEYIEKTEAIREYFILETTKKTEINEKTNTGTRRYTHHCKRTNQLKIFN